MTEDHRAAERAGQNMWRWSGLSFTVVENTLELGDIDDVVRSIQPEFAEVEVRRRVAGPMAGGLYPEAALLLAFAIAAHGFLQELGKDAYKGFRAALFTAYKKARTWANGRGYGRLNVQIETEAGVIVVFIFPPTLEETEFESVLGAALSFFRETDFEQAPRGGPRHVVVEFNPESRAWRIWDTT